MAGSNDALDQALQCAGLTLEQLASALNARLRSVGLTRHQIHPKTPWKWIRRGEVPHQPLPGFVAELLGEQTGQTLTVDELGLASGRRATSAVPADDGLVVSYSDGSTHQVMAEIARRGVGDSRRLLPLRGPALIQHAHRWLVAGTQEDDTGSATGPTGSTAPAVGVFRTLVNELRRLDDVEGGGQVWRWAARETAWAATAVRDGWYGPSAERALLQVVAELAQVAGWAAMDSNRHAEAQRFHVMALRTAEAAGDREFGAYVLCMLAFDATLAGQHEQAIMILDTAGQGIRNHASRTVQAMVAGWQARAYAGAGDRVAFERTLARASSLYERAQPGEAPPWAYWMVDPGRLAENARSWALVGDGRRAVDLLEGDIAGLGEQYPRDRALFTAYLAEAHADRDPEHAARIGEQAFGALVGGLFSPRALAVVRALADRLAVVDTRATRRFVRHTTGRCAGAGTAGSPTG